MKSRSELRIVVLIVFLALILLLYGCSSEEKVVNDKDDDMDMVGVSEDEVGEVFIPLSDGLDGAFEDLDELEGN